MSRVKVNSSNQGARRIYPISIAASTDNMSVGTATGNAATVVLPALAAGATEQGSWVIGELVWSYSGAVSGGNLQIGDSSGQLLNVDLSGGTGDNFGTFTFDPPLSGQLQNSSLAVTLAGSLGLTAKLNVYAWQEF